MQRWLPYEGTPGLFWVCLALMEGSSEGEWGLSCCFIFCLCDFCQEKHHKMACESKAGFNSIETILNPGFSNKSPTPRAQFMENKNQLNTLHVPDHMEHERWPAVLLLPNQYVPAGLFLYIHQLVCSWQKCLTHNCNMNNNTAVRFGRKEDQKNKLAC